MTLDAHHRAMELVDQAERLGREGLLEAAREMYEEAAKLEEACADAVGEDQASEAGRRGIRYLTRARAFQALGAFASGVVTGTRDPALHGQVIADLHAAAAEVPAGQMRWHLRTYLADALRNAGRPDQALSLFAQAAEEAEAAEHWSDLGWIRQNWAGSS